MDLGNIEKGLDLSNKQQQLTIEPGMDAALTELEPTKLTAGEDHLLSEDRVEALVVTYICSKCKAVDHDKIRDGEMIAPAINCWKCGAGRGVELANMLQNRVGMFAQPIQLAAV